MILFVGGIRDGDRFVVPDDRDQWNVRERLKPIPISWPLPEVIEPVTIRQMAYQRMRFRGLKETYSIFAAPGLSPDDVLEKLIRGYEPEDSPQTQPAEPMP